MSGKCNPGTTVLTAEASKVRYSRTSQKALEHFIKDTDSHTSMLRPKPLHLNQDHTCV